SEVRLCCVKSAMSPADVPIPLALEQPLSCVVCGEVSAPSEVNSVRSNIRRHRDRKFSLWRCRRCRSLHSERVDNLAYYYEDYPMHNAKLDYFSRAWYRI